MNQLYQSFLFRFATHYHLEANDLDRIMQIIQNNHPTKLKRVVDLLFFVLAVNHRYSEDCHSILQYLSSHYHNYSIIQQGYLHFLCPSSPLSFDSSRLPSSWQDLFDDRINQANWISFYHAIQQQNIPQANSILVALSKTCTSPSTQVILLYNLLLLSNQQQFIALLPLFLQILPLPYPLLPYPLLHPNAFPSSLTTSEFSSFLIESVAIKGFSLHVHEPSFQSLIQQSDLPSLCLDVIMLFIHISRMEVVDSALLHRLSGSSNPVHRVLSV